MRCIFFVYCTVQTSHFVPNDIGKSGSWFWLCSSRQFASMWSTTNPIDFCFLWRVYSYESEHTSSIPCCFSLHHGSSFHSFHQRTWLSRPLCSPVQSSSNVHIWTDVCKMVGVNIAVKQIKYDRSADCATWKFGLRLTIDFLLVL